ncbi:MAG: hypothetical protein IKJ36_03115 [Clostridia bacterium]|nr:hypothetical protein [Clostridia bacterium]
MRKIILAIVLIISCVVCFGVICYGFEIGPAKVNGYSTIENLSAKKDNLLLKLNEKNITEFNSKKDNLQAVVDDYNTKKAEYDRLVKEGKIDNNSIHNTLDLYEIDYLWTKIGNYATEEDVTLQLDVTKSSTSTSISTEYVMCDLTFNVTGDYIALTDFLFDLEGDDSLRFEINDFVMQKGGQNLQATFVVKDVPIDSKTLSSVPTASSSAYSSSNLSN